MADALQTYIVTALAGDRVAGILHAGVGSTVELTPFAAAYELIQGNLVPDGTALPTPQVPALVSATDLVSALRGGGAYDFQVAELTQYLLAVMVAPIVEAARQQILGTVAAGTVGERLASLDYGLGAAEETLRGLAQAVVRLRTQDIPDLSADLTGLGDRLDQVEASTLAAAAPSYATQAAALAALTTARWGVARIEGRLSLWANDGGALVDLLQPGSY
ncbi:hypothetical protein [Methylobacterium aquaticum]|uniref:hypothetical protein n=1 Tax=Methylobacterium aquaticum TaxID=270351 RepID=UPI001931AD64|nr:hypothetical protein [Methylobacterium aquaticum]QRE74371.1 hypothetical protein F1D61_12820 [Methylobacterium aquaticum]